MIAAGAFASSFSTIFGKTYTSDTERELNSIPCLVAVALDEDPYMQFIRATAKRNNIAQPSVLHTKYLDGLQGVGSKMSASIDLSAIYVNDTPDEIRAKVGLQPSPSNQRPSVDLQTPNRDPERNVCYQYLKFFLEVRMAMFLYGWRVWPTNFCHRMMMNWPKSAMTTRQGGCHRTA